MYGYVGRLKTNEEIEHERKYGGKTDRELKEITKNMISKKLEERGARLEQRKAEYDAKYNLPYGGIVKAIAKAEKQIKDLENKPEKLLSDKRTELEAEYADLVMHGMQDTNRELWISEKLVKYMQEPDGEYRDAKTQLQQARKDYAIYLAKKVEWERENASIIEAERIRAKRVELLQADPDALRALGINPEMVHTSKKTTLEDDGNEALRKALRSIHPSASDAEIENMLKLVK